MKKIKKIVALIILQLTLPGFSFYSYAKESSGILGKEESDLFGYSLKDWYNSCSNRTEYCIEELNGAISVELDLDLDIGGTSLDVDGNLCPRAGHVIDLSNDVMDYMDKNKNKIFDSFGRGLRKILLSVYGCNKTHHQ